MDLSSVLGLIILLVAHGGASQDTLEIFGGGEQGSSVRRKLSSCNNCVVIEVGCGPSTPNIFHGEIAAFIQ